MVLIYSLTIALPMMPGMSGMGINPSIGYPYNAGYQQGSMQNFIMTNMWTNPQRSWGPNKYLGMPGSPAEGELPGQQKKSIEQFGQYPNNVIPSGPIIMPNGMAPGPVYGPTGSAVNAGRQWF